MRVDRKSFTSSNLFATRHKMGGSLNELASSDFSFQLLVRLLIPFH